MAAIVFAYAVLAVVLVMYVVRVNYLRRQQLPDGGFSLYDKGPGNLSATIKAYFAMKVGGVAPDDPAILVLCAFQSEVVDARD